MHNHSFVWVQADSLISCVLHFTIPSPLSMNICLQSSLTFDIYIKMSNETTLNDNMVVYLYYSTLDSSSVPFYLFVCFHRNIYINIILYILILHYIF